MGKDINHKILYTSICFIVIFVLMIYLIDWLFTQLKPEWIKTNGKIDPHKKFTYSLLIAFFINISFVLVLYQLFA